MAYKCIQSGVILASFKYYGSGYSRGYLQVMEKSIPHLA
nr:MAG TPA: hypothetical protein [Caudoviricetes sp.]